MTDQERFIELIESFGITKSEFSVLGEILPMGACEVYKYQVYPELPRDDDAIRVRLGGALKSFVEFTFIRGKFAFWSSSSPIHE